MDNKFVEEITNKTRKMANEAITDSIDSAQLFISKGMYILAIDELNHLKRLISSKEEYYDRLLKIKNDYIEVLTKEKA